MRKCLRCNSKMVDDLILPVGENGRIYPPGIFSRSFGKVKCMVCPKCGYIELYLENLDRLERYLNEKEDEEKIND